MSASNVNNSPEKERKLLIDNLMEGISNLELTQDNLHIMSDNFNPTRRDKEKTDEILQLSKRLLTLSESQGSEDGLRQDQQE